MGALFKMTFCQGPFSDNQESSGLFDPLSETEKRARVSYRRPLLAESGSARVCGDMTGIGA
jgi:hypothetical protein